jgi:hypothetical protein
MARIGTEPSGPEMPPPVKHLDATAAQVAHVCAVSRPTPDSVDRRSYLKFGGCQTSPDNVADLRVGAKASGPQRFTTRPDPEDGCTTYTTIRTGLQHRTLWGNVGRLCLTVRHFGHNKYLYHSLLSGESDGNDGLWHDLLSSLLLIM